MERRRFLTSSLAASTLALQGVRRLSANQGSSPNGREYYQLRKYHLESGPQLKLTNAYLEHALIPALNRLGISPVGVFNLDLGPETPMIYVLLPSTSLESLVAVDLHLAHDEEFLKGAAAFWAAPAKDPAFVRVESSLMIAFEGRPKLTVPPVSSQKGKRVFQLRTYESPSNADHLRKVEMFHDGEFDIFQRAGFWQVFYGDTLIGPRLPNLTYMLSFPSVAEMDSKWDAFRSDPQWKKLSASPKYSYESIVTNITNLILSPASYSQI
ncbi:MAG: NIPSNAP family protein [Acidobacteriaceae bacterium]|nr:NIPSNAP family protein [Acidobacteriaceae bacterium]